MSAEASAMSATSATLGDSMGSPVRIAIFSAQYPPHMGGVEYFMQSLANAFAAKGIEVTVVANDTDGLGAGIVDEGGIEVVRLPCVSLAGGRLPLSRHSAERRRILRDLRNRSYDGVLVNTRFYPHSLLGLSLARRWGVRPVLLDHGSAYLSFENPVLDPFVRVWEHALTSLGRRYGAAYYGVSQKSCEWLRTFGIEASGVISNSIDAEDYRACSSGRDFRTELGLGTEQPMVAFVGRLVSEKGVPAIIEASRATQLRDRGVVFVLAGDGPLSNDVRDAEGEGLRWVGRLERAEVSALLQQAYLLCLPTRSEGFSTTLLEASACGCPSVVTDVGGARELIPDEGYGTVIESMRATDVVGAIARLADDPDLREAQAKACRGLVEKSFSWDSTASVALSAMLGR